MEETLSNKLQILTRVENRAVGTSVHKDPPKISVIIPAYDVAPIIAETLDSVFAQTYGDFEAILIDDGSNDTQELRKAIQPYASKLVYAEQANAGASAARNSAMCLARGSYFAFLDGDDIWYPEFLESQYSFLKQMSYEMVYCNAELFGDTHRYNRRLMQFEPSIGEVTPVSLLNSRCSVITSGTLLKRSCIERFGMFDLTALRGQDFDLWFRLSLNGVKIGYQQRTLLRYRVSTSGLTGNNVARAEREISILKLVKRKYELTDILSSELDKRIEKCTSERDLENAKICLVKRNFVDAALYLRKANTTNTSIKLTVITAILDVAPQLVLLAFKTFRSREFTFISSSSV